MKKLALLFIIVIMASAALAAPSDDLFDRAVNKYFLGDNEAAISLLNQALSLDPQNAKVKTLLAEIEKESGQPVALPASAVVVAPVLTVKPVVRTPVLRPRVRKEPVKENKLQLTFPRIDASSTGNSYLEMDKTINQIAWLLGFVLIMTLLVAFRGLYFVIRDYLALKRRQICPECRTPNPEAAEFCGHCGVRLKTWSGITENQKRWFAKVHWDRNPFALTIIPSLFTGYAEKVNLVMEKVHSRSGHILIYGEKGVGKTTLLRWLAENLQQDFHAVYVSRPPLVFEDMTCLIANELLGQHFWQNSKKCSLYDLESLVKKVKKPIVILLDEAHEFTAEIEQQMRSLGDLSGVTYVLAGLPEAREKIKKDSPPFFDRIVLEVSLEHLNLAETKDLIRKRIEAAGGQGVKPFTDVAIENIFKMSLGRPRMILKVCDWVMTDAIRNNADVIGAETGKDFPVTGLDEVKPAGKEAEQK